MGGILGLRERLRERRTGARAGSGVRVLTGVLTGVLLACAAGTGCRGTRSEDPRAASLLLITVDTLRADHLGAYGYPRAATPHIDRLAQESVVFEHAYCAIPKTNPSLASLMTGLYPQSHGILELAVALPDAHDTLAERLAAAGYEAAGVVGQYNLVRRLGFAQGFDTYVDDFPPVPPGGDILGVFTPWAEKRAEAVADAALAWLEEPRDAPFFLWVHFMDPHAAYDPPPDWAPPAGPDSDYPATPLAPEEIFKQAYVPDERSLSYYLRHYDAEIRYLDDQVGRLLDALARRADGDDTWVVFTADHGEYMGDRDWPAFASPDGSERVRVPHFHHGATVSDGETRVPLLVRPPARAADAVAPRRVDEVVSLVDVLPTLIEVLGLPAADVDGRSFADLLSGGEPAEARVAILYAHESNAVALRTRDWKLVAHPEGSLADYFRGRRAPPAGGGLFLYAEETLDEGVNHVTAEPEARNAMLQRLFSTLETLRTRRLQRGVEPDAAAEDDEALRARLRALGYVEDDG